MFTLLYCNQALSFGFNESDSPWCKLYWIRFQILHFETWTNIWFLPCMILLSTYQCHSKAFWAFNNLKLLLFCHEKAEAAKMSKCGSPSEQENSVFCDSLNVNSAEEVVTVEEHAASAISDTQVQVQGRVRIPSGCLAWTLLLKNGMLLWKWKFSGEAPVLSCWRISSENRNLDQVLSAS